MTNLGPRKYFQLSCTLQLSIIRSSGWRQSSRHGVWGERLILSFGNASLHCEHAHTCRWSMRVTAGQREDVFNAHAISQAGLRQRLVRVDDVAV